ncbi:Aste57867_13921 [Aphanomyces stellatus]|uniref:Aste57867_13921 protein n=1 Tax=Aphanomyces stellatus TaxID=120398 RepID=A0A485L1K1_9STRA|nr:hypothetical protein As57867_013870 [Aphanomyces stellatus]VFT90751.1 Aste57867_13921 [Aphanomyces stellatus]
MISSAVALPLTIVLVSMLPAIAAPMNDQPPPYAMPGNARFRGGPQVADYRPPQQEAYAPNAYYAPPQRECGGVGGGYGGYGGSYGVSRGYSNSYGAAYGTGFF